MIGGPLGAAVVAEAVAGAAVLDVAVVVDDLLLLEQAATSSERHIATTTEVADFPVCQGPCLACLVVTCPPSRTLRS
ncbi:MAG TPA: hypothetical protein VMU90_12780 [Solirubrobacteraceae bacterium]|nr:hypothetical protein [Solirubrobacteraceae bacterium]